MGRRPDPKPEKPVVTRYHTADGRRCAKATPGAVKTTEQADSYYVRLTDPATGKRGWVPLGTADLGQAWARLREILAERHREASGISGPSVRQAARPIAEHVADWLAYLTAAGRTSEEQVRQVGSRVRRLCGLAGWERLPQVTRISAVQALAKLGSAGRGARTRNHYLRHLKQFCTWCVEDERLDRSPAAGIDPLNAEADVRHPRRSPSEADVGLLMAYLEGQADAKPPVRCRMTGQQRGLGYRVSMATGFRAKELRSLTPESFDLDAGTVTVRAAYSKDRKTAVMQLPAWLVDEVRAWLAGGGKLWKDFPRNWPGRLLLADQEDCGVAHRTEEGFFDFHSLRHWYCTWAANRPGISPKTLQAMARHSDPRLTLKIYAKPLDAEVRRVIDQMPRPGGQ